MTLSPIRSIRSTDSMPLSSGRMPGSGPESICVIRLSAIGDCCHTLPVLRTVQAAWPGTRITWVIGKTEHGLMKGVDGIEFITFDKAQPWASLAEIRRQTARTPLPDPAPHARLHARESREPHGERGAAHRLRPAPRARLPVAVHAPRRFRRSPNSTSWTACSDSWSTSASANASCAGTSRCPTRTAPSPPRGAASDSPVVVISPCSSQRFRNYRNWRAENYAAVVNHLQRQHGARVLLTGGPDRHRAAVRSGHRSGGRRSRW